MAISKFNVFLKKNGPSSASFYLFLGLFKHIIQQINAKNVHPVSGARIRTHDPQIKCHLVLPPDQGSRPITLTQCWSWAQYAVC